MQSLQYKAQSAVLHPEIRGYRNGAVEDLLEEAFPYEHLESTKWNQWINEINEDDDEEFVPYKFINNEINENDDEEFVPYKFINNEIGEDDTSRAWCTLIWN